ncbi:MAG: WD40 repeat domain-containing protein, partial [Cyanobacteria bacterium P01_F01_bin.116]
LIRTLEGHKGEVWNVSFSPDGQTIASASSDQTIKLWRPNGTLIREIRPDYLSWSISFSPDSQTIVSGGTDGKIRLWQLDGTLIQTFEGSDGWIRSVSFSPDGQTIASASSGTGNSTNKTIRLWDIDGSLIDILDKNTRSWSVTFSPDGQTIASGNAENTIKLWAVNNTDFATAKDRTLGDLMRLSCEWMSDYLNTNPNVTQSEKTACEPYILPLETEEPSSPTLSTGRSTRTR